MKGSRSLPAEALPCLERSSLRAASSPGPIESKGAAEKLWNTPEAVRRITETVPLKRWGKPQDVADAVTFLVSEHASFITGEILTVDGGSWLGKGPYGFV